MRLDKNDGRFQRQFDRLERAVPSPLARTLKVLRHPLAMLIRIPLGVLFVLGGIFQFSARPRHLDAAAGPIALSS